MSRAVLELEARRAVSRQAMVTEGVPRHALEDPGSAGIGGCLALAVMGPVEITLGGEADACERLGWAAVAPPHTAVLAVELVVVLTGLRRPGANSTLAAANLDDAVALR